MLMCFGVVVKKKNIQIKLINNNFIWSLFWIPYICPAPQALTYVWDWLVWKLEQLTVCLTNFSFDINYNRLCFCRYRCQLIWQIVWITIFLLACLPALLIFTYSLPLFVYCCHCSFHPLKSILFSASSGKLQTFVIQFNPYQVTQSLPLNF